MDKTERNSKPHWRAGLLSSAENVIWATVIVALLVGIVFIAYRARLASRPPEYEGRIVDKWAGYTHSNLGSHPYLQLLVETRNGQRMTISVDQDLYERAKVGTWIKKTQTGLELSQAKPANAYTVFQGSIKCDFASSKSNV